MLDVLLYAQLPFAFLDSLEFFNEMPEVFKSDALNFSTLSRFILWVLFVSWNPNLNSLPLRIPGFSALQCKCSHSRSGILFPDDPHASGDVIIFIRQVLSFSDLSTSSLSSLEPYSNYAGVNIFLMIGFFSFSPNYFPPRKSASIFAGYLRPTFCSPAKGYA